MDGHRGESFVAQKGLRQTKKSEERSFESRLSFGCKAEEGDIVARQASRIYGASWFYLHNADEVLQMHHVLMGSQDHESCEAGEEERMLRSL